MMPHPPAGARGAGMVARGGLLAHQARPGMPAFGGTHDDETIWNIAAFVKGMPEMSEQQ